MQDYKAKIGLEVHVQLATKTKMFCRCLADNNMNDPNVLICPVCLALPGALPVLNEKACELAMIAAMAINCQIQHESRFDRKNYFYPDLPKGYQISQLFAPLAIQGALVINEDGVDKTIRINRLHLEEDTAKLTHAGKVSLMDYNRSGIPLMEIVSEPDIDSPKLAGNFLKKLREILVWNKVSEARMQLGEMRCDANISLIDATGKQVGEVVEIKNMNSFKSVEKALSYEFERQKQQYEKGEKITKETRGYDAEHNLTISQRSKEFAHDYRYFPEPDVPRVVMSEEKIEKLRQQMIGTTEEIIEQMADKFGIHKDLAKDLLENKVSGRLFEEMMTEMALKDANDIAKVVVHIMWPLMLNKKIDVEKLNIEKIKQLIQFYLDKKINKLQLTEILVMINDGGNLDLHDYVEKINGVSSEKLLDLFQIFIKQNPKQVEMYMLVEKKEAVTNFFVGFVKKHLQGGGDVDQIKKLLEDEMNNL